MVPGTTAMVFQEAFLLAGTVRQNLAMAGSSRTTRCGGRCDAASADDFVRALPAGLDTIVGERGVSLSGGPETASRLGTRAAAPSGTADPGRHDLGARPHHRGEVLGNLRSATTGTATLMVASRPSTIALADDVVFLHGGTVAGHGTHDQLMATNAAYRRLGRSVRDRPCRRREADVGKATDGDDRWLTR